MQHIQDKDFDQLFKDRFEDAEVQPSAGLWSNIKREIEPKKQRKLPVRWMAAASVTAVLGMLLLFNKTEKVQLHGQVAVISNGTKAVAPVAERTNYSISAPKPGVQANKQYNRPKEQKSLLAMQPATAESRHDHVEDVVKPSKTELQVSEELPEVEVALATSVNEATTINEAVAVNPVGTIKETSEAMNTEAAESEQPARARIRNAGDLLNFVVEKLDKREQKILEFETDADDNSSLVAINIGPFKFNSRKHK